MYIEGLLIKLVCLAFFSYNNIGYQRQDIDSAACTGYLLKLNFAFSL